ncbi:Hpt domain-containing protein [Maritalea mobilis]|uniref:Hpt domain-containing protein n=1 Tax=Maritalea mobilis TaxID=483324 RepID=UPI001C941838|nr:Hpt domain-containing protein [Maritalea mobilis]MBY6201654.1 Hpt domain-containing protein [Maritalea mobilis]
MSLIDWGRLATLREDIGPESFDDIAMMFVTEIQDTLDRFTPGSETAADFHFLKGSAANMGLLAMVEACARAEETCDAGFTADIEDVKAVFLQSLAELETRMPSQIAAA